MTPADIQRGAVYRIGEGCGVPYEWAPLILRVITVHHIDTNWGRAWLTGYELDANGDATARRDVYVGQVAGIRPVVDKPFQPRCTCPPTSLRIPHRGDCRRYMAGRDRQDNVNDRMKQQAERGLIPKPRRVPNERPRVPRPRPPADTTTTTTATRGRTR